MRVLEKCVRFLSVYDRTIPRENRRRTKERVKGEKERREMGARGTRRQKRSPGRKWKLVSNSSDSKPGKMNG